MALLHSTNTSLQAAAAYVVGTAASNNVQFQQHLLQEVPDVFHILVKVGVLAAVLCCAVVTLCCV